jgi:hypothetical protein
MKYLEELTPGESFTLDNVLFVLTSDYKATNKKLCYSLINGSPRWLDDKSVVEICPLYTLDKDNNVIAVKSSKNNV